MEEQRRNGRNLELGGTQATAMMTTHGGADIGRSPGGGRADESMGADQQWQSRWWRRPRRKTDEPG